MRFVLVNTQASIDSMHASGKSSLVKTPWAQPLGLLYIAAVLEKQGHSVECVDLLAEDWSEEKVKGWLSSKDAVGLSVDSFGYPEAAKITRVMKQLDPDLPIVIGGPHCTFYPQKCLVDIPDADVSVEGEGEHAVVDIVEALQGRKQWGDIAGVRFRKGGVIKAGRPAEIITDLDALPFPARHLVSKYEYGRFGRGFLYTPRFTSLATTRGCPFRCRFCTRHVVGMDVFRQRSVGNVTAELSQIASEGFRSVMIVDDNFTTDASRVHSILDHIIAQGIDLEIVIQGSRVDTADEALYAKMRRAGVKAINFGIESGNQDVLDFYQKNITLEQIRWAVGLSHRMGFVTVGNFILGAPIETRAHIRRTMRFARSLPLDYASFTILRYSYHSDLWDEAFAAGKITSEECYSVMSDSRKGLGNFTEGELRSYERQALLNVYARPSYVARQLVRLVRTHDFSQMRILASSLTRL